MLTACVKPDQHELRRATTFEWLHIFGKPRFDLACEYACRRRPCSSHSAAAASRAAYIDFTRVVTSVSFNYLILRVLVLVDPAFFHVVPSARLLAANASTR